MAWKQLFVFASKGPGEVELDFLINPDSIGYVWAGQTGLWVGTTGPSDLTLSTQNLARVVIDKDGVTHFHGLSELEGITVAQLPQGDAARPGMMAHVNDATAPALDDPVVGGGDAFAMVVFNRTAWKVIAV